MRPTKSVPFLDSLTTVVVFFVTGFIQPGIRCPSQYSTQVLGCNKPTNAATGFCKMLVLVFCPTRLSVRDQTMSPVWTSPTKAPWEQRDLVVFVTKFAIRKHMSKPYGVSKVSMLWSAFDTRYYPYTCYLPSPVARPLNIESDVAYWYCH